MEPYFWPVDLPQFPDRDQFRIIAPNNTVTASMEYGPEKTRRRTSSAPGKMRVRYLLEEYTVPDGQPGNINQVDLWNAFYQVVDCTMAFWLPNPKKQDEYMLVRIVADGEEDGPPISPAGALSWYLDLTLRTYPNVPRRPRNA